MNGIQTLDVAYKKLEAELPRRIGLCLTWLRSPPARWVRVPVGLAFIACAMFWFLPIVGIELLPIGLLILAQDVPWLRKPVGRLILFAVDRWRRMKRWYQVRRRRATHR